jgi:hypothetical protein
MGTKTNYDINKREYGVALRNRYVETCAVGSLAIYMFMLYQQMEFPSFQTREKWFRRPLFLNRNGDAINYQTHNASIKKLFEKLNISTTKVTQIGSKGGLGFLGIRYLIRYHGLR